MIPLGVKPLVQVCIFPADNVCLNHEHPIGGLFRDHLGSTSLYSWKFLASGAKRDRIDDAEHLSAGVEITKISVGQMVERHTDAGAAV